MTKTTRLSLSLWTGVLLAGTVLWLVYELSRKDDLYELMPIGPGLNKSQKLTPNMLINYSRVFDQPKDYIESSSAVQRIHETIDSINLLMGLNFVHEYLYKTELEQSALPIVNQTQCGLQVDWILRRLEQNPDYINLEGKLGQELTSLMDSFGHQETGFFTQGANQWVGSAELCSRVSLDEGRVRTRHCFGNYRFKLWPKGNAAHIVTVLRIGLCLPETCDTSSSQHHKSKIEQLGKHQLSDTLKQSLYLESLYCIPDERSPLRQISTGGKVYLILVAIWIAFLLGNTLVCELILRPKFNHNNLNTLRIPKLLEALTLRGSLKALNTTGWKHKEASRVDLRILDFIRVMMALAIIQVHCLLFCCFLAAARRPITDLSRSPLSLIILSSGRFVDTFLTIFGIIVSYSSLNSVKPNQLMKLKFWLYMNVNIALRISPIYVIIYMFNALIFRFIHSGPLWDYGIDHTSLSGGCKLAHWWQSIPLFTTVGKYPAPLCNSAGWFLGAYSQIALIAPLIIYLMASYRSYLNRIGLTFAIVLISCSNVGLKFYRQQVIPIEAISDHGGFLAGFVEKYESTGFFDTLSHLGSVTIGILCGYYLHKYESGKIDKFPAWAVGSSTNLILILIHIIIVILPLFAGLKDKKNRDSLTVTQFSIANSTLMAIWPVINAWLILIATTTYKHNTLIKMFKHPFWHSFNKIGFALYLVHMSIVNYILLADEKSTSNATYFDLFRVGCQVTFVSILVALLVYLFFEAPIEQIRHFVFKSKRITEKPSEPKNALGSEEFREDSN